MADEVHQEIEDIRPSLPAGVELSVFYDQSNIVRESIGSVRDAIIIGLLLAGFIIWLFLRDWGTALMTGLVIPVAIFVTFIAMKILGQSFNMMTLGGLAAAGGLGHRRRHRGGREHRAAPRRRRRPARSGDTARCKELTIPLIGSTLTPIVVFLPLISITGVTGTFFRALAIAMSVSLFTSLGPGAHLDHEPGRPPHPPREHPEPAAPARAREPRLWTRKPRIERMKRMMAAEEASLRGGLFEKIIEFYERWLRRALEHPVWLGGLCAS